MMKVSVVMSTYNGEKYILEQLNSLKNQTRSIDEVIIGDDCSNDRTVEIIQKFISQNGLDNWSVKVNKSNKGWKVNFYDLMCAATGDVIFPCDQDDIWREDKIEVMTAAMEANPDIYVLEGQPFKFFDEQPAKERGKSLRVQIGIIMDRNENRKKVCKNSKEISLIRFNADFLKCNPACALAIQKEFFASIRDYWFKEIPHDTFVTYYSRLIGHYYILDYYVLNFRLHVGSASRPVERNKKRRIQELELNTKIFEEMRSYTNGCKEEIIPEENIKVLENAEKWNSLRKEVVIRNRKEKAIQLLFYKKYYTQFRRYFTDLKYGMEK